MYYGGYHLQYKFKFDLIVRGGMNQEYDKGLAEIISNRLSGRGTILD